MSGASRGVRPLPELTERNRPYWIAGRDGVLRMQRCGACRHVLHPPVLRCPYDHGDDLAWEEMSGSGRVEAWTENQHSWLPGLDALYLVALVALDEDPRARILTNLVGVDAASVSTGMAVTVVFEHAVDLDGEDVWLPLFTPAGSGEPA